MHREFVLFDINKRRLAPTLPVIATKRDGEIRCERLVRTNAIGKSVQLPNRQVNPLGLTIIVARIWGG